MHADATSTRAGEEVLSDTHEDFKADPVVRVHCIVLVRLVYRQPVKPYTGKVSGRAGRRKGRTYIIPTTNPRNTAPIVLSKDGRPRVSGRDGIVSCGERVPVGGQWGFEGQGGAIFSYPSSPPRLYQASCSGRNPLKKKRRPAHEYVIQARPWWNCGLDGRIVPRIITTPDST